MSSFLKYLIFWSPFKINSDWVILWYKWEPKNNLLVIPEEIWWVKVVEIEYKAFYQKWLKNVILPNSLKKIWNRAFAKNNIENLIIPDSVEEIDEYAFRSNKIENLTIWKNTKIIWEWAFLENNIKNLSLPKNITKIGYSAFCKKDNIDKYYESYYYNDIDEPYIKSYDINKNIQWYDFCYKYTYDDKNHIYYKEMYYDDYYYYYYNYDYDYEEIEEEEFKYDYINDEWNKIVREEMYNIKNEVGNINYY